ncbi:MAG: hypothetical protein V4850_31060 [Myxococcota bacterium]
MTTEVEDVVDTWCFEEKGEESCNFAGSDEYSATFHENATCADVGYPVSCGSGSWEADAEDC